MSYNIDPTIRRPGERANKWLASFLRRPPRSVLRMAPDGGVIRVTGPATRVNGARQRERDTGKKPGRAV